jgi:tRNA A37 methylthiotransferase MiaB
MKDFLQSLHVTLLFDECVIINYSDIPGTQASKILPKIKTEEQNKRLKIAKEMGALTRKISFVV